MRTARTGSSLRALVALVATACADGPNNVPDSAPFIDGSVDLADSGTKEAEAAAADSATAPPKRDPLQQPFASESIWNMPLGANAVYVAANLRAVPGGASTWREPGAEVEHIVLTPTAPNVDVYTSSAGWSGDRCPATGALIVSVPIPLDFLVPSGPYNDAAAILGADGRTISNFEPLARCAKGGIATALAHWPDADLYGLGIDGAHGGSGLSGIGGSLRLGELRPGQPAPKHALKFTLYMKETYRCSAPATCHRWPAPTCDSYAVNFYGTGASNPNVNNAAMTMGSLLALPAGVDLSTLGLKTEAASQIAWTLQNYGAYVVEDSYGPAFWIATQHSPNGTFTDQFKGDYGFDFNQSSDSGTDWSHDIQALLPVLMVVDNNGPTSVGGGGTPRQPLAPPISP